MWPRLLRVSSVSSWLVSAIGILLSALAPAVSVHATDEIEQLVSLAGFHGGLVVCVGCEDGRMITEIPAHGGFLVQGLATVPVDVEKARSLIRSKGLSGRVSARVFDGIHLPYVDNMVNCLIVEAVGDIPEKEMMRAVAGGID